jgi:eukaryotic-like serine/threonine-protein kinase
MATPNATVPEYCAAVLRSKLLADADLAPVRKRWQADGGADADVDGFRKFLVREKCLTEYQAALIQRGRADGFVVGEYVIQDRIGRGQTAGVYKAVHKSGQVVALKVLAASKARDPHVLNRFLREGRLLTQLDHPNVVRAYQVGQASGVHFIVMEHVDGETLDEVLERRKRLPPAEAVRLAQQAFHGLQHLHERRMVHRDLKPANLMLTPAGKPDTTDATVQILDIGLGRELFDDAAPSTQDLQLTGEGALLGTPDYLAPEQARDARTADVRADIYSLGCVLYQLIAGHPPFQDKNVMAQMVHHATAKPKPLGECGVPVPAGLQAVIDRLLDKKPENRPQTPAEAALALAPYLPEKARQPEKAAVLPAYKQWLDSESAFELPLDVRATLLPANKPLTRPAPPLAKPGTAAAPALPPVPAAPPEPVINVELVSWPPAPAPVPPPARSRRDDAEDEIEEKSPFELGRRDFVMLGLGAVGVLLAVGFGYALSRLTARKKDDEPPEPPSN